MHPVWYCVALFFSFFLNISSTVQAMEEIFTFNATTVQSQPDTLWMILDPTCTMYRAIFLLNPQKIKNILRIAKNKQLSGPEIAHMLIILDQKIASYQNNKAFYFPNLFYGTLINYAQGFVQDKYTQLGIGALEYALTKCVIKYSLVKALKDTYPATIIYESEDSFLGQNASNNSDGANEVGKILMRIRDGFIPKKLPIKNVQKAFVGVKKALRPQPRSWWQQVIHYWQ